MLTEKLRNKTLSEEDRRYFEEKIPKLDRALKGYIKIQKDNDSLRNGTPEEKRMTQKRILQSAGLSGSAGPSRNAGRGGRR